MPYDIDACDEPWDAMTPKGSGRHCDRCQKTVVDGTRMTEKEFSELIGKSEELPCVRLNWRRGQGPVFRQKPQRRGPALVLLTAVAACGSPEPETTLGIPVSVEEGSPEVDHTVGRISVAADPHIPCESEENAEGEHAVLGNMIEAVEGEGSEQGADTGAEAAEGEGAEQDADTGAEAAEGEGAEQGADTGVAGPPEPEEPLMLLGALRGRPDPAGVLGDEPCDSAEEAAAEPCDAEDAAAADAPVQAVRGRIRHVPDGPSEKR